MIKSYTNESLILPCINKIKYKKQIISIHKYTLKISRYCCMVTTNIKCVWDFIFRKGKYLLSTVH